MFISCSFKYEVNEFVVLFFKSPDGPQLKEKKENNYDRNKPDFFYC